MSKSVKSYSNNVKQNLLMDSLKTFFLKEENLNIIMPIINGDSKISLRVMDWFVTNYSKKNNISYLIDNNGEIITDITDQNNGKEFVVYLDYKLQLKGYQKKQFDPFCRRDRIQFYYNNDDYITTTVGQLNFFKWTIKNSVLSYIENNLVDIEKDMNDCYKAVYSVDKGSNNKGKSSRRKRQELSISATKKLNKSNVKIYVSFD
tara:strand:+ start:449 stop:1060 length:612 start_codon:yes stop_codon:yes gene_type:complete